MLLYKSILTQAFNLLLTFFLTKMWMKGLQYCLAAYNYFFDL